jgi:hypothetical protein
VVGIVVPRSAQIAAVAVAVRIVAEDTDSVFVGVIIVRCGVLRDIAGVRMRVIAWVL